MQSSIRRRSLCVLASLASTQTKAFPKHWTGLLPHCHFRYPARRSLHVTAHTLAELPVVGQAVVPYLIRSPIHISDKWLTKMSVPCKVDRREFMMDEISNRKNRHTK